MKILFVNRNQGSAGGQEIILQHLANGLHARGHQCTILTTNGSGRFTLLHPDIAVISIPGIPFFDDYLYQPGVMQTIREATETHDIVFLNNPIQTILTLYVLRALRPGQKIFFAFHAKGIVPSSRVKNALVAIRKRVLIRMAHCSASGFIFLTDEDQVFFLQYLRHRKPDLRTAVIPNGIDTDRFRPAVAPTTPDHFRVLFVGRLLKSKGVADLIEAATRLRQRADIQFQFAGQGPLLSVIQQQPNCVALGILDQETMWATYQQSSLVALPSYAECFPLVMIEAMAAAKPLVVSDIFSLRSILGNQAEAQCIQPGRVEQLVERITFFTDHPEESQSIGQKNRERVETQYAMQQMIERYESFLCQ